MKGRIRIERMPGFLSRADGKPVFIPAGATFCAVSEDTILARIETLSSALIEAKADHVIVDAIEADNPGHILIGASKHVYRPSWSSRDPSPGKPETASDWKTAELQAVPLAAFS